MKIRIKNNKLKRTANISYLVIGVIALICFPLILRAFTNNTLVGQDPYFHSIVVEKLLGGDISEKNSMVYGGRELHFTPYHFITAGLAMMIGIKTSLMILPIICAAISVVLFYLLLKRFRFKRIERLIAALILASSPVFIYTAIATQDSFAIIATLAGFSLFFEKKSLWKAVSVVCFIIASLFSIFNILIIIIALLSYSLAFKKRQKLSMLVIFAVLCTYMFNPVPLFYNVSGISTHTIQDIISDLGGFYGIGVFFIILFFIGMGASWKDNRKYYPLYAILLIFSAFYYIGGSYVMVYAVFLLSVFASKGFMQLKEHKWNMKIIRNFTFILIICGLLFSYLSFSTRISQMTPDEKISVGLEYLHDNSKDDDVIVSHYSNGYFIEYFSGRKALTDSYFDTIKKGDKRFLDSYDLFSAADITEAENIMDEYGIRYIVVTEDMKEGLVWERPDEGLLFLFRNNQTFKNVYSSDSIEIWKYLERI